MKKYKKITITFCNKPTKEELCQLMKHVRQTINMLLRKKDLKEAKIVQVRQGQKEIGGKGNGKKIPRG